MSEKGYNTYINHYLPESFDQAESLSDEELYVLLGNILSTLNEPSIRFVKEEIINKVNKSVEIQISNDSELINKLELHNLRYCQIPSNTLFHKNLIELAEKENQDYFNYSQMAQKKRDRHPRGILFSILRSLINSEGGFIKTRYIIDKYKEEIFSAQVENIKEKDFTYLVDQMHIGLGQQWTLKTILERFKSKVHDFDRLRLRDLVPTSGQKEKPLQLELARYLFDNGHSPFIEVTQDNERLDIFVDYNGKHIVEVKVYDGDKSKIDNGFNQIHSYTTKHGQRVGYYVIFQIDEKKKLDFTFNELNVNDRIIYCFVIDLTGVSGSKETRKSITINHKYVEKLLLTQ